MATMHYFPGQPFHLPFLIRRGRVISPPSTYQPPGSSYQPVVLAYPAPLYAPISALAMTLLMSIKPGTGPRAPLLTWAPASLAVPA